MRVYTADEYRLKSKALARDIVAGAVFVYPTDTIYGLGCNALDKDAVNRLREIKKNPDRPLSVIVPTKGWIYENCFTELGADWIEKLPGPYTLILGLKSPRCVAPNVHLDKGSLGVRMPMHWCLELARLCRVPIITTSANIAGEDYMTSAENLSEEIRAQIDFFIDEGPIEGRPSTIVDLTGDRPVVNERQKIYKPSGQ